MQQWRVWTLGHRWSQPSLATLRGKYQFCHRLTHSYHSAGIARVVPGEYLVIWTASYSVVGSNKLLENLSAINKLCLLNKLLLVGLSMSNFNNYEITPKFNNITMFTSINKVTSVYWNHTIIFDEMNSI